MSSGPSWQTTYTCRRGVGETSTLRRAISARWGSGLGWVRGKLPTQRMGPRLAEALSSKIEVKVEEKALLGDDIALQRQSRLYLGRGVGVVRPECMPSLRRCRHRGSNSWVVRKREVCLDIPEVLPSVSVSQKTERNAKQNVNELEAGHSTHFP